LLKKWHITLTTRIRMLVVGVARHKSWSCGGSCCSNRDLSFGDKISLTPGCLLLWLRGTGVGVGEVLVAATGDLSFGDKIGLTPGDFATILPETLQSLSLLVTLTSLKISSLLCRMKFLFFNLLNQDKI
jgi:hypothetical protein